MAKSADNQLAAYVRELEHLVNIDSGSKDIEGVSKVGIFFKEKFAEMGWITNKVTPSEEIAPCWEMYNRKADDIDILLLGHMDTVFPHGTVSKRPFSGDGTNAYGPGAADMKSGLLLGYHALKTLQENGELAKAAVCFALNSEEELSSMHTRSWLETLARRSKLVLVLEPARPEGELVHTRKGVARYQIEFQGIAAHSGVNPEAGASAIAELGHWIIELQSLTDFTRGTTVNVGLVSGGTAANVVAENASATVDVRFTSLAEFTRIESVIKKLQAAPEIRNVAVGVTGGMTRPPMVPNEKTIEICKEIEMLGQDCGIDIKWKAVGGGSDGNFSAVLNIPTIDALGPIGGNSHSSKEYVELSSILPRLNLLRKIIAHNIDK